MSLYFYILFIYMANTRFFYDDCRTIKQLQQATGPGRYMLDVPGNGLAPSYMEDPYIRIQKWGGNLRTNTVELESELWGGNRPLNNKDCIKKDNYKTYNIFSEPIQYPSNNKLTTEQSRAVAPAWMFRDLEQVDWYTLPLNPQENTCIPFSNNLNTRILEKDYFVRNPECSIQKESVGNELPTFFNSIRGSYVGGSNVCTTTDMCSYL
jgi:hypothetical protein